MKTLEVVQGAGETKGEKNGIEICQYEDVPFIRPEVKITFSTFTASTLPQTRTVAARKKAPNEMPAKNVLLQWLTLKREIRDLFDLKVLSTGERVLLWRLVLAAEALCWSLAALGRYKSPFNAYNGLVDPRGEGFRATLLQEALEKPLAELRNCVKAYEDVKPKQIAAKSA